MRPCWPPPDRRDTALPPDNLKDLIAYIKANSTKLNLGNAGLGAASHLCGLLFMSTIETSEIEKWGPIIKKAGIYAD